MPGIGREEAEQRYRRLRDQQQVAQRFLASGIAMAAMIYKQVVLDV